MRKPTSYAKYLSFFNEKAFAWACYFLVIGLFLSRALVSISCVLIVVFGLLNYFNQEVKKRISLEFLFFPLIYFVLLISFFWTSHFIIWQKLIFVNSIFLLLPIGMYFGPDFLKKEVKNIFLLFSGLCFLLILSTAFKAILNYQQFIDEVERSKNLMLPIGPDHSEMSVLSVVAFFIGINLYQTEKTKWLKTFFLIALISFFIALNIIAFRFSLICIYLMLMLYSLWSIKKAPKRSLIYLSSLLMIPILAFLLYFTLPSIQKRVQNTLTDLRSVTSDRNPNFQSLGQRWAAMKCSWEVIKKHPFLGTSPADAEFEIQRQYDINSYLLIPQNRIFIHNQLIYYVLVYGIPFGLVFIFLLSKLFIKLYQRSPFYIMILLPFIFHMQIENTLEKQITANAFLFLFFLSFKQIKKAA
ncbi:MAG: O-antigen ligase family protein [Sphingobacteriales bacterium]|nr:O-antigen ligase family protein [Sphingobacteriales bacterium]